MTNPTTPARFRLAAAVTAVALGLSGVAVAQQGQSDQQQQQQNQSDMAPVQIKRSSTWGFSNEVRVYLSGAYEKMYADPEVAIEKLKFATNLAEILAAAAPEGQGRQDLQKAAADLSRFAQGVENRQITNPDELGKPGAAVTLAIAQVQFDDAKRALEAGEESGVAYSLDSAAANLLQTHIYLKKTPSQGVAKAAYNAARLGAQLKSLVEPTTQQGGNYAVTVPEEKSDYEGDTLLDNVRLAGDQQGGESDAKTVAGRIKSTVSPVMKALEKALEESKQAVAQGANQQ